MPTHLALSFVPHLQELLAARGLRQPDECFLPLTKLDCTAAQLERSAFDSCLRNTDGR